MHEQASLGTAPVQVKESPQHDISEDHENDNTEDSSVDILLLNPLLAAVYDGVTYRLVGRKRTPKLQCLLCT